MSERDANSRPDIADDAPRSYSKALNLSLCGLLLVYVVARFLQLSERVPILIVIALHVLPPLFFAFFHGAALYRFRGTAVFVLSFLLIGNIFENLSVFTGFPFGHYYFTDQMGPKIFEVPIFLGLAYVGMAYLSWILANLIFKTEQSSLPGAKLVLVPTLASLIMVAWDLSQEPAWSTVLHLWIWPRGGVYFGVPLSNFFGWYFNVYVIYQLFALYLRRNSAAPVPKPRGYWRLPVLFYAASAAGNVLLIVRKTPSLLVTDAIGAQWMIRDLTLSGALVSIFIMGSFALFAWMRVRRMGLSGPGYRLSSHDVSNYARI